MWVVLGAQHLAGLVQWAETVALCLAGLSWGQEMPCRFPAEGQLWEQWLRQLVASPQAANMERVIVNLTLHPSSPVSVPGMTIHMRCFTGKQFQLASTAADRQWCSVHLSWEFICFKRALLIFWGLQHLLSKFLGPRFPAVVFKFDGDDPGSRGRSSVGVEHSGLSWVHCSGIHALSVSLCTLWTSRL